MTTRGFQCKFAVASGQDREPIRLEQLPDGILFMHIVFNEQNHNRFHINLFNGLRASKEIFCDIAATSLKIRDLNFADCIVAPGLRGRNRSIPMESTCNGKEKPEGLLRNVGLVCALPKLEIPTGHMTGAGLTKAYPAAPCVPICATSQPFGRSDAAWHAFRLHFRHLWFICVHTGERIEYALDRCLHFIARSGFLRRCFRADQRLRPATWGLARRSHRRGKWEERLLAATSTDGLTFTRTNNIITDQARSPNLIIADGTQIGRASCRERV